MGRLINTDELKSAICEYVHRNGDASCKNQTSSCLYSGIRVCDFVNIVNSVPTALDVNNVEEQLKRNVVIGADCVGEGFECIPAFKVFEIVGGGGIE